MRLQPHYQGSFGMFPCPAYIFHIGPTAACPGGGLDRFEVRKAEVRQLLDPDHPRFAVLDKVLEAGLGQPVSALFAEVRMGGWQGEICPDLWINTQRSTTRDGRILYWKVSREQGAALGRGLLEVLRAEWVVCWHFYRKPLQVVCRPGDGAAR